MKSLVQYLSLLSKRGSAEGLPSCVYVKYYPSLQCTRAAVIVSTILESNIANTSLVDFDSNEHWKVKLDDGKSNQRGTFPGQCSRQRTCCPFDLFISTASEHSSYLLLIPTPSTSSSTRHSSEPVQLSENPLPFPPVHWDDLRTFISVCDDSSNISVVRWKMCLSTNYYRCSAPAVASIYRSVRPWDIRLALRWLLKYLYRPEGVFSGQYEFLRTGYRLTYPFVWPLERRLRLS